MTERKEKRKEQEFSTPSNEVSMFMSILTFDGPDERIICRRAGVHENQSPEIFPF